MTVYIAEAHAKDEWTLRDSANAELDGKFVSALILPGKQRKSLAFAATRM